MENKVIINLDEYLIMRDNTKRLVDMLEPFTKHLIIEIKMEQEPGYGKRKIVIGEYYLKEFLNMVMNTKGLDIEVVRERE